MIIETVLEDEMQDTTIDMKTDTRILASLRYVLQLTGKFYEQIFTRILDDNIMVIMALLPTLLCVLTSTDVK